VKKLVMYGLIIVAIGVLLYLLDMFGMGLGISFNMNGISMFPLVTLVVIGLLVMLYGYKKK
jgi:formate hydrogenlyase subunit 3/multisubunit Na+/H+ antiporter MnhD subunit